VDPQAILYGISVWLLPILFAITLHEAAHGWMAEKLGDDTARRMGRVTINPIKHVDPFGTIVLPGLLLVFGAPVIFGYAKPVPVAFHRLNNPKRDMIWVAIAGPVVNIALALACALALHGVVFLPEPIAPWVGQNLVHAILINTVLAVFNMLPIPPLDGGRVLTGLLPDDLAWRFARLERFGLFALVALLFLIPIAAAQLGFHFNPLVILILPVLNFFLEMILGVTGARELYILFAWMT
jgi:Zn-dependent protease